jgi:hypothetical protein
VPVDWIDLLSSWRVRSRRLGFARAVRVLAVPPRAHAPQKISLVRLVF